MFLQRLIKPGPARGVGEALYASTVAQARSPALYERLGAPDTPNGRFEVYTLHVLLVLERLRIIGSQASPASQAYFDAYLSGLDNGLRELAVGDLSVGKTMRKLGEAFYGRGKTMRTLGEAFYGRGKALDTAIAALPDREPLDALLARTVFGGADGAGAAPLGDYLLRARQALAEAPLLVGEIPWPALA